jgi:chlorite dismutase
MDEHMRIGAEHATIHNHTTYSFGIDDQEFMTAFECEEPADFMHLMLRLRESEASRYTERDTPIFVGQLMEIRAALDRLDGVAASVQASTYE